ncbi:MAG: hypothetical protein PF495_13675 [Spirochaetales bacterium]|nr:hypothetical protein [Spirochaetales bacterium]
MSSFTTVFKLPRKALRKIAKTVDNPAPRFELSEMDRQSLATSGERFRKWLERSKADDGPADS